MYMLLTFGHQGAGGYEPGNTLRSFRKALEFKLDFIELDIARCKTGEIVAIHDATVDRTTNGKGFVADKTFQELRALDAGKGEKIPTLQEALDVVDRKTNVNIEIKGEGVAQTVVDIIEQYIKDKKWSYDNFLISSFNHHELEIIHSVCPHIKLGAVVAGIPITYAECAVKVNAYAIHLSKEFITKVFVDDAHQRGLKVFAYTINDRNYLDKVRALGVDGIFTDFPDKVCS